MELSFAIEGVGSTGEEQGREDGQAAAEKDIGFTKPLPHREGDDDGERGEGHCSCESTAGMRLDGVRGGFGKRSGGALCAGTKLYD